MRPKKRYVLAKEYPANLPKDCLFLYQDAAGYVFKISLETLEEFPKEKIVLKSGSIAKIKRLSNDKTPKC
jgi:hypothetical protein